MLSLLFVVSNSLWPPWTIACQAPLSSTKEREWLPGCFRSIWVRMGLRERSIMDNMTREGHPQWKIGDKRHRVKGTWGWRIQTFLPLSICNDVFLHNCCTKFFPPQETLSPPPFFSAVSLVVAGAITKSSHQYFASSGLISKPSVQFSSVQLLSCVRLFVTPWIAAHQASLSITNFWSSLKLTSIKSVMPSSHHILCCPLFLLPPISPSIRVFSNESTLRMRWP